MATSGTVGVTTVPVDEIYEAAARRCGVTPDRLTPEAVQTLARTLFIMLSNWSNRGVNLWRIQRPLIGLVAGQAAYTLETGTIDVLNANFLAPLPLTATATSSAGGTASYVNDQDVDTVLTQVSTNGNVSFDLGSTTQISLIGILPGASGTWNYSFQYSDDGVTWTTLSSYSSVTIVDGAWKWYMLDPSPTAQYLRLVASGGTTLVLREVMLSNSWSSVPLYRMNRDEYSQLPNKQMQATQVYQYWLDRQLVPIMRTWPVSNTWFSLLELQVHMHIEDAGDMPNTLDVPQRWLEAVIACLAYGVLTELPGADLSRAAVLKEAAVEPEFDASSEERDKSTISLLPLISRYTR